MNHPEIGKVHVIIFTVFLYLLHLPFVFASTDPFVKQTGSITPLTHKVPVLDSALTDTMNFYEHLQLSKMGLSEKVFNYAMKGYQYLDEQGKIGRAKILSIVDLSKPSRFKRLYIIDLENEKVLFHSYVAHGRGSGESEAHQFSNTAQSYQSSLGFYITSGTYIGKNGYSMYLNGIETGFNDKAEERAIVMHGAPYVNESLIRSQGYIGRSWGCPAVPEKLNKPIVDQIKNGSCLFIYADNKNYLKQSRILNS